MITGRFRVKCAIRHESLDRIPFYCDELLLDTELRWLKEGMPASQVEREDLFGYDCTDLFLDSSMRFEPKLIEENDQTITVADKYGFVATRYKRRTEIRYHEHPIKTPKDWQRYKERLHVDFGGRSRIHEVSYFKPFEVWPSWPQAAEIFETKRASGRYITLRVYGPWELIWRLRGYNEAMMDFYDHREMIEDIVDHYTSFLVDVVNKGIEYGIKPDCLFLLEDFGYNKGLLFSPDIINSLLSPCYKRIGRFLKERDIDFFLHSCGDIRSVIPMLINWGVDVLNPLQATAVEVVELKNQYGRKITFLGSINSRILHNRKAILAEMNRKIPVVMRGGGFIFACDHSVPSNLSLEDYMFILSEARRLGTFQKG